MMCERWCGKIDEKAYERDKDRYSGLKADIYPKDILKNRFEFFGRNWYELLGGAKEMFGNMTWMDWGSYFCRGDYETMKRFLAWNKVDEKAMEKFEKLPKEGDYGFVFIEDY